MYYVIIEQVFITLMFQCTAVESEADKESQQDVPMSSTIKEFFLSRVSMILTIAEVFVES